MFKDIAVASGKTEGVIRSMFDYFEKNQSCPFWEIIGTASKKYNMSSVTATYIYRCYQKQGVA